MLPAMLHFRQETSYHPLWLITKIILMWWCELLLLFPQVLLWLYIFATKLWSHHSDSNSWFLLQQLAKFLLLSLWRLSPKHIGTLGSAPQPVSSRAILKKALLEDITGLDSRIDHLLPYHGCPLRWYWSTIVNTVYILLF